MEVHCLTPCTILALPWQVNPGEFRMTFVVKSTYDLAPGETACLADVQLPPSGDEVYDDDEEGAGSLRRRLRRRLLQAAGRCPPVGCRTVREVCRSRCCEFRCVWARCRK